MSQCPRDWQHGDVGFGVVGSVLAVAEWDPDGGGPEPALVVMGGAFVQAGAMRARNLVLWDPGTEQFSTLSMGTDGAVSAVAVDAQNHLVIGGSFTEVDGVWAPGIARWDGTAWHSYGSGIAGTVLALTLDASGELIAGGSFSVAGAVTAHNVARWDSASGTWTGMGSGLQMSGSAEVRTFAVMPNGNLIAGGVFNSSGANSMRHMARWTGADWVAHDTGLLAWDETVDLLALPNGDLIATGDGLFVRVIRRTNGVWTTATTDPGTPEAITVAANGRILAGRNSSLVELVNGSWQILATLPGPYNAIRCILPTPGGQATDVILGGSTSSNGLVRYEAGNLVAGPSAFLGSCFCTDAGDDGSLYAGGTFTAVEGVAANRIAVLRNGAWEPLGSGLPGTVYYIVAFSPQDVYAMVRTLGSQGYSPYHWDGATWQPVPGGPSNGRVAIGTASGELLVGGDTLALFDGSVWQTIPGARDVLYLHQLSNGDIAASGFSDAILFQERTGIWDGTSWTLTPGTGTVARMFETPQGELLVSGQFLNGQRLGYWNGSGWVVPAGISGFVYDMARMANGNTLAAGSLDLAGYGSTSLAQWDGQVWTPVYSDLELPVGDNQTAINFVEVLPDGSVAAQTGFFVNYLPMLRSTCPPTLADTGSGCASSHGANRLSSEAWPQIGGTYRATGSELPTNCFVADLLGTASINLPIDTVLPTALPGCVLHLDPVLFHGSTTSNGRYRSELLIPSSAQLIGLSFLQQLLPMEIDATGSLADVTATNALELTIGAF